MVMQVLLMQHKNEKDYINSIKKFITNFENNSFREKAINSFAGWPGPKEETWSFSRLGTLSRKNIKPINPCLNKVNMIESKSQGSCCLHFVDGLLRKDLSNKLPIGVNVSFLDENDSNAFLAKIKKTKLANHPSTNLSIACTPSIVKVTINKEFKSNKVLEIIYSGGDNNTSTHPVLFLKVDKNCNVSIIETFKHSGTLIMPLQLIEIDESASINSIKIFDDDIDCFNLSAHFVTLAEKSIYKSFSLVKGSKFTRSETHAHFNGEEADMTLNGVYLSGGAQHHDLTTAIYHDVPNCVSRQIVRGVLGGESTGVFQGKVRVAPDAQKSDGQQMSKALLLSDKALANAKPELEIYADDVICAHGATVGELEDDQLFYLNSRGIPMNLARKMLTEAFLDDIITKSVDNDFHSLLFNEAKIGLSSIIES